MKIGKSLLCFLCFLMLTSCAKEKLEITPPAKAEPISVKTELPVYTAKKLLDTEILNMGEHDYLMAQYVENNELYYSAIHLDNENAVNFLCRYDLTDHTVEVLKQLEGNYVINSFVYTEDALIYSKIEPVSETDNYNRFTVMMETEEGGREIDHGLTTDYISYNAKMRSPQLIKAGEKVFYATEDYTKDYENDSAYNVRFVMLDGDKRVDLISENADTKDFMGVYNAYEKIFSYGSKLAVIIKQTPDMQLVTYEDDNKKSEKYIYSDDRQAIYIYDVTTSELKQFQSDKEVEFSCFVDENTLYAIDTSIKIVDNMLFDTETGEFKQIKNDDYFYGYNTVDSWAEGKMLAHSDQPDVTKSTPASYAMLAVNDGLLMSAKIEFDELPETRSRIVKVNDDEILVNTADCFWIIS